jgi:hypothetical protein
VTRHGKNAVVIVAYHDTVDAEPDQNFKDFLMSIPGVGLEIKPSRSGILSTEALQHDLTFATRNVRHIAKTGVVIVDPF